MEIRQSARKHGISDEDMLHAVQFPQATGRLSADKTLYLGHNREGNTLLEVIVVEATMPSERIIHADIARRKFYPFLPANR